MIDNQFYVLCQYSRNHNPQLKNRKCFWLHHSKPFLKLGPFKLELLHWNFEIGVLHDFIEENEAKELKTHVRGRMQTTPYYVNSKGESSTSKVKSVTGQRVIIFMGFHGRVESGQKLSKSPRVTGSTGNLVYLVRGGSRVGLHGSGNLQKNKNS